MSARLVAAAMALLLALPLVALTLSLGASTAEVWAHLAATRLPEYLRNTFLLVLGVGLGSIVLALPTAWLMARTQFRGQRLLRVSLLLPLALPPYLLAYCVTDAFHESGTLHGTLAALPGLGWVVASLPPVRSLWGATFVLSASLYPYLYLMLHAAFLEQAPLFDEAASSLGAGRWRRLWRIHWPLLRPSLVAGLALISMEVLGDFGAVDYFAVDTLSTGIFRTWFGLGNQMAAAQLALLLVGLVAFFLVLERLQRARRSFSSGRRRPCKRRLLGVGGAFGAWIFCLVPLFLGFLMPATILVHHALGAVWRVAWEPALHTLFLSLGASLCVLVTGLSLALATRRKSSRGMRVAGHLAALGYALPGAVLAVAVLVVFGGVGEMLRRLGGSGVFLTGSLMGLLYAYCVRFTAIPYQGASAALARIAPAWEESAGLLGENSWGVARRVVLPLLRPSLGASLVMVFVECTKELPATMILRPFNFETLAVTTYTLASDERLADASPVALAIVAVGLIPVMLMARLMTHRHEPVLPEPEEVLHAAR